MNKEDILSNLLKRCIGWTFRGDDADEVLEIYKHEVKETERLQQENQKYKEVISKVREHIKSKITKSFDYDYGIDTSNSSDRLFTETVIELETIDDILKEVK